MWTKISTLNVKRCRSGKCEKNSTLNGSFVDKVPHCAFFLRINKSQFSLIFSGSGPSRRVGRASQVGGGG